MVFFGGLLNHEFRTNCSIKTLQCMFDLQNKCKIVIVENRNVNQKTA